MKQLYTLIIFMGWLCQAQAAPFAYIGHILSNQLSMIDSASQQVFKTVPVGSNPFSVAVSPDSSRAYLTHLKDKRLSVFNGSPPSVINTIAVGKTPQGVVVSQDGNRVYVPKFGSNIVSVMDAATLKIQKNITVGSGASTSGQFIAPHTHLKNSVARAKLDSFICQNLTTRQSVILNNPVGSANCEAAGLIVHTGDLITLVNKGIAQ